MGAICSNTSTIPDFAFTTFDCTTTTLSTCNPLSPSIDIICQILPVVNIPNTGDDAYITSQTETHQFFGKPPLVNSTKITGIQSAIFIPDCIRTISDSVNILDVSVQTIFMHSSVGNLEVYLEHETIPTLLFGGVENRDGDPEWDCDSSNVDVTIFDASPNKEQCGGEDNYNCNEIPLTLKPVTPLSVYGNTAVNGYWYLYIFDYFKEISNPDNPRSIPNTGTFGEWILKVTLDTCWDPLCSANPTISPSINPTMPSINPTISPSINPTISPTAETNIPSKSPTAETNIPSKSPTTETNIPSKSPTAESNDNDNDSDSDSD
eukprot:478770_1